MTLKKTIPDENVETFVLITSQTSALLSEMSSRQVDTERGRFSGRNKSVQSKTCRQDKETQQGPVQQSDTQVFRQFGLGPLDIKGFSSGSILANLGYLTDILGYCRSFFSLLKLVAMDYHSEMGWRNWANLAAYVVNLGMTYGSLTGLDFLLSASFSFLLFKVWTKMNWGIVWFRCWTGFGSGIFGKTNTELSQKYQTLVTPAGYAFSIWGPIFIWEGIFAVAQMFPSFRSTNVVRSITPWWIAACIFQCCWTVTFARESIFISFWCMVGILVSLLGGIIRSDLQPYSNKEFWLLRAPFSLHGGAEQELRE